MRSHKKAIAIILVCIVIFPSQNILSLPHDIIATVSINSPARDIDINKSTNKVYLANSGLNTVSVIDITDDVIQVIDTVEVDEGPSSLAVNEFTNKIFVLNVISKNIFVIDGKENKHSIIKIIELPENSQPRKIASNDLKNRLYVTSTGNDLIYVIDQTNYQIIDEIRFVTNPFAVKINKSTNEIYVSDIKFGLVSVIDGNTHTLLNEFKVGSGRGSIAVNEYTNQIIIVSSSEPFVHVVDPIKNGGNETILEVGTMPTNVVVDKYTNRIYVTNEGAGTVSVVNLHNNIVLDNIAVGFSPSLIVLDEEKDRAYITSRFTNTLIIIEMGGRDQFVKRGCLIATAVYGTELAPQVQMLREIRDNKLIPTKIGSSFLNYFNSFYYSFSPQVSEWIVKSDVVKSAVKLVITPGIFILTLMTLVEPTNEISVGIFGSLTILAILAIYVIFPIMFFHKLSRIFSLRNKVAILG